MANTARHSNVAAFVAEAGLLLVATDKRGANYLLPPKYINIYL